MNIAVIGSRENIVKSEVLATIESTFERESPTYWSDIRLVTGGARGVDTMAMVTGPV